MAELPRTAPADRAAGVRLVPVSSLRRLHELLCLAVVLQILTLLLNFRP